MRASDLERLLDGAAGTPLTAPIEEHLLAIATERRLPRLAIAVCTLRLEEAAPALRAAVVRAAEAGVLTDAEAMTVFRGVHILGGGRDTATFAPLLRLLALAPERVDYLLGDSITGTLSRIVVGTFDGDAEVLFGAIADQARDQFVRNALLGAVTFLTWEGRIDRAAAIAFLHRFYRDRLAEDGDYAWVGWLECVAHLGLRSLAPLVEAGWGEGRVPEQVLEWRHFEADLAAAEREPNNPGRLTAARLGYIEDVLMALEPYSWAEDSDYFETPPYADAFPPSEPRTNPLRHVGRNEPCPCGSGKKYKKCCLAD